MEDYNFELEKHSRVLSPGVVQTNASIEIAESAGIEQAGNCAHESKKNHQNGGVKDPPLLSQIVQPTPEWWPQSLRSLKRMLRVSNEPPQPTVILVIESSITLDC
jgi:hypothetical protein